MHVEVSHPILRSLVNTLRNNTLSPFLFRHTVHEITKLLSYEAFRDIPLQPKSITTWRGEERFDFLDESQIVVVSVLRAALPMHEALLELLGGAVSGFLGIKRDETTHIAKLYYDRLGDCHGKTVVLVDPMVATGGSLCDAIEIIKQKGGERILSLNVIGSPEGIKVVEERHPDVKIYIAQVDEKLDANKFIIPGLGDAGDREYNTL